MAGWQVMRSQLYGMGATAPVTVGLVALGVVTTALLAAWPYARQAARTDPAVALKG
jgi:putative ABC transport system permease protein